MVGWLVVMMMILYRVLAVCVGDRRRGCGNGGRSYGSRGRGKCAVVPCGCVYTLLCVLCVSVCIWKEKRNCVCVGADDDETIMM